MCGINAHKAVAIFFIHLSSNICHMAGFGLLSILYQGLVPVECTVTSQLDYIMNIIIALCSSWHALDRACCVQRLTERLRKKKTDTEGLLLARRRVVCLSLVSNTVVLLTMHTCILYV